MSSYTALIPVTVTILVPVSVPGDPPETTDIGIAGLPCAHFDQTDPASLPLLEAALADEHVTEALELLCAAVQAYRRTQPLARALATPWLGTVPEVSI